MLGSITPLGERGRGRVWGRTVVALILGGAVGGAALGALAGAAGQLLTDVTGVGSGTRLWLLAVALGAACLLDLSGRVPTPHRQVNEDWLTLYRDWVYGLGFGFQLGFGLATIVTTASIFALIAAAALTGSVGGGVLVGVTFGALRSATVMLGARARTPEASGRLALTLERLERPAKIVTPAVLAALGAGALVATVGLG
jgi:hypothetical protein